MNTIECAQTSAYMTLALAENIAELDRSIESEYAFSAIAYFEHWKNDSWLLMRENLISPEQYAEICDKADYAVSTIYEALQYEKPQSILSINTIAYQPKQYCKNVRITRINPTADSCMVINWDYPAIKHPRAYSDYSRKTVRVWVTYDKNHAGSMWVTLARSNMPTDMSAAVAFFRGAIEEILFYL